MKGIAHFLSGVAVATFFPDAVNLAATQSSFILVLGGIGGLLPDTLDFRFSRFFENSDVDIDPHPAHFDAQAIAARVAEVIDRVAETRQKQILQLRTMRLGTDLWQQYSLYFDVQNRGVAVKLGPVVNTSQMPMPEGFVLDTASASKELCNSTNCPGEVQREGHATVKTAIVPTYGAETQIDIFGGPSFELEWRNGAVEINFIPWHRQWSHSFTLAVLLGILVAIPFGRTAGVIAALGVAIHVVEDQLGFLGSNLLYPFTRRRSQGLRLIHSGEAVPNLFTVWTALALILFNLDRYSAQPLIEPLKYFGLVWLPVLLLLAAYIYRRLRAEKRPTDSWVPFQQKDLAEETQEAMDR